MRCGDAIDNRNDTLTSTEGGVNFTMNEKIEWKKLVYARLRTTPVE
jgi:hypothetical protein